MSISVLTIVRGRQQHLDNQRLGLLQSELLPQEWIIIGMDQDVTVEPAKGLTTITDRVDSEGASLPLAEARNLAAELSSNEKLIFLDVDCIPDPQMLTEFNHALTEPATQSHLWMGNALYLPAEATSASWTFPELRRRAVQHPLLPKLSAGDQQSSDRYELFWSLCFGVLKKTYNRIGGFDSRYEGYGGEDTDFSFQARAMQIEFGFLGATAFHQHHSVCKPPLNHLKAIVANAKTFFEKWQIWPMESWLNQFVEAGFVEFDVNKNLLEIIQEPTAEEIAAATSLTPAGF